MTETIREISVGVLKDCAEQALKHLGEEEPDVKTIAKQMRDTGCLIVDYVTAMEVKHEQRKTA